MNNESNNSGLLILFFNFLLMAFFLRIRPNNINIEDYFPMPKTRIDDNGIEMKEEMDEMVGNSVVREEMMRRNKEYFHCCCEEEECNEEEREDEELEIINTNTDTV
jgi:hypothetical protein